MKKIISLLLAVVLAFSSICCVNASAADYPFIDENGIYHRLSNGTDISFDTDYQRVIQSVKNHFLQHDTAFTVNFASADVRFAYTYSNDSEYVAAVSAITGFWNTIFYDAFTDPSCTEGKNNARAGDYLFSTIDLSDFYSVGVTPYYNSGDLMNVDGVTTQYYAFTVKISGIHYNTEMLWEEEVDSFMSAFSEAYLNSSMSEYEKVKTIYDFVVRNTDYDDEVRNTGLTHSRYNLSHSAYGALYGNNLKNGKTTYNIKAKTIATGQKVVLDYNQGLAVCEGYSKLFYCLCVYNGIKCRIVDGDFSAESGKATDPHEWNYVYLDDNGGEGYKWFQVDTTFAASASFKEIDLNSYDFFLRGKENVHFSTVEHQQPYLTGIAPYYDETSTIRPQLYYWDEAENASSYLDYRFQKANFTALEDVTYSAVICRVTDYGGEVGEVSSYIYSDAVSAKRIEVDVDETKNKTVYYTDVDGFTYNAHYSVYSAILPYVIDEEIVFDVRLNAKNVGNYQMIITGRDSSEYTATFRIVPMNMSNASNYAVVQIPDYVTYTGKPVKPTEIMINDGYEDLTEGVDFVLQYKDSGGNSVEAPKNIGKYTVSVHFMGNHSGDYKKDNKNNNFEVQKIRLSLITIKEPYVVRYLPASVLKSNNIQSAADYIKQYSAFGVPLVKGKDFTAESGDSLEYGTKGKILLKGIDNTESLVLPGAAYYRSIDYTVSEKFDITTLGLKAADTNTKNIRYYDGTAQKPVQFDIIDNVLVKGKDYKIVSYSNNVNAGKAYVTVQGINGCEGTLTLPFMINPVALSKAQISVNTKNGNVIPTVTYGGKTLTKGKDYTEKQTKTSGSVKIILTGIGNFTGTQQVNVVVSDSGGSQTAVNVKPSKLSKVTAGKKAFTAKWKKVTGDVTGYHVQYSTTKKFTANTTKTVTVKGASKTSCTVKKLKKGKKYYVRIRTYYTKGKYTYCTSWSAAKAVKTK